MLAEPQALELLDQLAHSVTSSWLVAQIVSFHLLSIVVSKVL
jgi:hypothetical protein